MTPPFHPELGRINAKVRAHVLEHSLAEFLLEILDRGPSGSMAATTPARIHFESCAAPPGKPA
jgi:hypothetical protein